MQRQESCGSIFFIWHHVGDPWDGEGYSFELEQFFGWKEMEEGLASGTVWKARNGLPLEMKLSIEDGPLTLVAFIDWLGCK